MGSSRLSRSKESKQRQRKAAQIKSAHCARARAARTFALAHHRALAPVPATRPSTTTPSAAAGPHRLTIV